MTQGYDVLNTLRELACCFQAFESYTSELIRTHGLTAPQFDLIATLGNSGGMSFKELGNATLTTKGTLTGIVDRLEGRGIVRRVESDLDRRSTRVELTDAGKVLFEEVFPNVLAQTQAVFELLGEDRRISLEANLHELRHAFTMLRPKRN